MSTLAQISANQKNAQLSTGPRTPEGKAAASKNAFKFGLTSKQIVLPSEDPDEFESLHNGLLNQWDPRTDGERMLVDDMAAARWRIRRIDKVQTVHMALTEQNGATLSDIYLGDALRKFQKYATAERRIYESAWRKLTAIQKERKVLEIREHARQLTASRPLQRHREDFQNEPDPQGPEPEFPIDDAGA